MNLQLKTKTQLYNKSILMAEGIHLNDDSYRLSVLVNACKIHNDTLTVRLLIQKGLMTMILDVVGEFYMTRGGPYLAKMYKAVSVLLGLILLKLLMFSQLIKKREFKFCSEVLGLIQLHKSHKKSL